MGNTKNTDILVVLIIKMRMKYLRTLVHNVAWRLINMSMRDHFTRKGRFIYLTLAQKLKHLTLYNCIFYFWGFFKTNNF